MYVSVNRNEFGITTIDTHHEASEMLSVMCGDDDLAVRSTKRALETSAARGTLNRQTGLQVPDEQEGILGICDPLVAQPRELVLDLLE